MDPEGENHSPSNNMSYLQEKHEGSCSSLTAWVCHCCWPPGPWAKDHPLACHQFSETKETWSWQTPQWAQRWSGTEKRKQSSNIRKHPPHHPNTAQPYNARPDTLGSSMKLGRAVEISPRVFREQLTSWDRISQAASADSVLLSTCGYRTQTLSINSNNWTTAFYVWLDVPCSKPL